MGKNNIKYTYEEVKIIIKEYGYELISKEYINSKINLTLRDIDGYLYFSNLSRIIKNIQPSKFGNNNPYTFTNIKLWFKFNTFPLELISEDCMDVKQTLIFKDKEGYYYTITFSNIQLGKIPRKFHKSNPYTIKNIKLWLVLNNMSNFKLITGKYVDRQQLIFKDSNGYMYLGNFNRMQQGDIPRRFDKSNPYTIQNMKLWCKLNNKPFELISYIYNGTYDNLQWQCLKEECGEIFEANWACIHSGRGCSVCVGRQVGLSNCLATRRPDWISEWHSTKNGNLTPWDITENYSKEVWWQCENNPKHIWNISPNGRSHHDSGCPYCSGRLPSEDYNLLIINPKLCEEWNYEKNNCNIPEQYCPSSGDYVWWKCKKCGYEWMAKISNRKNGRGCPECAESKGEKEIDNILLKNNWTKIIQEEYDILSNFDKQKQYYFIPQKTFKNLRGVGNGLLSYDHYLPNINLLIEYQGQYHDGTVSNQSEEEFIIQKEHDKRKREYAEQNHIKLLEIWYWDFDNIETILDNYLSNLNKPIEQVIR